MTAAENSRSSTSPEGALESYSRVACSRLALGIKAASWVGYGAESAALAVGSAAEASIVFVDATSAPVGPKTVALGSNMNLELDSNGVKDFSIILSSSTASVSRKPRWHAPRARAGERDRTPACSRTRRAPTHAR